MLKIILISIPILFVLGSLLHFAYNFTNQNAIIGLFAPINESVFEHSKLLLTPLTLFWNILFFIEKSDVNINNYFFSMLISIIVSITTMISFMWNDSIIQNMLKEQLNIISCIIQQQIKKAGQHGE